jgi:hypothetical protein
VKRNWLRMAGDLVVPAFMVCGTTLFAEAMSFVVWQMQAMGMQSAGTLWLPYAAAVALLFMHVVLLCLAWRLGHDAGMEDGREQGFGAGREAATRDINDALYAEQVRMRTAGITGVVIHDAEDHPSLPKAPPPPLFPDGRLPPHIQPPPRWGGKAGGEGT